MNPYRIHLSIGLRHPERDLAQVCSALGLVPTGVWKKGDERRTPNGRKLEGYRHDSCGIIDVGEYSGISMLEPIQSILDRLEPHKEILRELVDSGGIVSFRVGWFLDGHTGETFHPHLMEKMADLGISVEFFVYVPDVVPPQTVER